MRSRPGRLSRAAAMASAVALIAAVAGCTSSSAPATTASGPTTTAPAPVAPTTLDPRLRLALPIDPGVLRGELDNGLSYYIRENRAPGGRAELRLLVDAGSVQEDPDQAGMAHFLEHMMFNGTERFPRNELITVLESFGPRFGPDINAHTTPDETVYELSLTTDEPGLLELGIEVLGQWAEAATLTETDVVEERGVVLDEWRLRAQGFDARVADELEALILAGSAYEGHDPIGTTDSIGSTSPAELRRFYDDWYHPERLAVVAVGDFTASEVEDLIVAEFGGLEPADDPREWDTPDYEPSDEARAAVLVDEEATFTGLTVLWPIDQDPLETVGDYQSRLATTLALEILADRLDDDSTLAESPLLGAAALDFEWTREIGVRGVDVTIRVEQGDDALNHVLGEVERLRREGITTDELERAVSGYRVLSTQLYEQRDSAQDIEFANRIVAHHLSGADLMSPGQRFDVESEILDGMTDEVMEEALGDFLLRPPSVLVVGPDAATTLPDEATVVAAIEAMSGMVLDDRVDPADVATILMERPDPVDPESTTVDPNFDFTTLEFGNGATVFLWESDIARESVYAQIEGFGGTSRVDTDDLVEAFLMTDIVDRSGVAGFDVPALRRLLADRLVSLQPWISETRQGMEGSSSTQDVETLFQLIHLTMTNPRFDGVAVEAVLDEMRALDASRDDVPELLFEQALNDAYYGDDPRYFVIPSASQIADFDVNVADRLFTERFGDPGVFAFALVGDFDTDEMTELAARYIGTLPAGPDRSEGFVDHQPLPPRAVQVETVAAGEGDQGQVGLFFTNEFQPQLEDRLTARLLELILTARLRERVREELGATYSIFAGVDLQRDPDPFAESFVISTGDPAGLQVIANEILSDIEALRSEGPTDSQFDTAVEQLRDELELLDNRTLSNGLVNAYLYPDEPVVQLAERYPLIDELTPEDVRLLAGAVFDLGQRIEVRQVPGS